MVLSHGYSWWRIYADMLKDKFTFCDMLDLYLGCNMLDLSLGCNMLDLYSGVGVTCWICTRGWV